MGKHKLVIVFLSLLAIILISLGTFYLYVTKVEGQSIESKLAEYYLRIKGGKEKYVDKVKFAEFMEIKRVENAKPYNFPADLKLKSDVSMETMEGMQVFFINRNGQTAKKQILYLHGGAYVNQPSNEQWIFIDKLARNTSATVIFPIYPKAPNHQYGETFDRLLPIYENLITKTSPVNITVLGDSTGGGLCLAFTQMLLEKGLPQPGNIILLSPWLDITMNNPDIPALEKDDPMLGAYGLAEIGKIWAGDSDLNNYLLSPINGQIKGLGSITLFVGTHELFLPDARKFRDMAAAQGVKINYFEYPKMNHDFPLYPIPEAAKAADEITNIINNR